MPFEEVESRGGEEQSVKKFEAKDLSPDPLAKNETNDLPPDPLAKNETEDLPPDPLAKNEAKDLPPDPLAKNEAEDLPPDPLAKNEAKDLPPDPLAKNETEDLPPDSENLPERTDQTDDFGNLSKELGTRYDDNGNPYRIGDDLIPNNSYEINGYQYQTDALGRIKSVTGFLYIKNRVGRLPIKDSIEAIGKGDQKETDDRGHVIGDQFDGPNGLENMIPQDANINRKEYKNFENELAREVNSGNTVKVEIQLSYPEGSRRPDVIIVKYSINGVQNVRFFPNNPDASEG